MRTHSFNLFNRGLSTMTTKTRHVAGSNSSLLEAFSQILNQTSKKPSENTKAMLKLNSTANSLTPAPEYDSSSSIKSINHETKVRIFNPGEVYFPEDILINQSGRKCQQADPFNLKSKKSTDIFRVNKIDLSRAHLNVGLLSGMISPLGKIYKRNKTGYTAKTQRHLAKAIKRARQMGLLPYMYKPIAKKPLY